MRNLTNIFAMKIKKKKKRKENRNDDKKERRRRSLKRFKCISIFPKQGKKYLNLSENIMLSHGINIPPVNL